NPPCLVIPKLTLSKRYIVIGDEREREEKGSPTRSVIELWNSGTTSWWVRYLNRIYGKHFARWPPSPGMLVLPPTSGRYFWHAPPGLDRCAPKSTIVLNSCFLMDSRNRHSLLESLKTIAGERVRRLRLNGDSINPPNEEDDRSRKNASFVEKTSGDSVIAERFNQDDFPTF
ncbi:hypothetical protein K0M31_000762, partial [Melipona bicolor]